MNCKVISLYGPPGTGKSTTAAHLFALLKWQGANVELVTEYAKDLVWEERNKTIKNQAYIFGKQHHRLFRLKDKVDYIITDSPLLLSQFYNEMYGDNSQFFKDYIIDETRKFNNINILLKRVKPYNPLGRYQTEEESDSFYPIMEKMLLDMNEPFIKLDAVKGVADEILKIINEIKE